jgi:hypothetical protein
MSMKINRLRHITTKTTRSIKVTPEPAPIPIYINYGLKFVVLGYNSTYFSNKVQKCKTCYSEEQVNRSKVCKNIMYFWWLMHYLQLFLHDNIPNNNKIRPIKILSIHYSRYLTYRFTNQIRCTTINKTSIPSNDITILHKLQNIDI